MPLGGACRFNPRAREGRDADRFSKMRDGPVSIHAPVKGATCDCLRLRLRIVRFNPRAREGRDDG